MNAPARTIHLLRDNPRAFTAADKALIHRLHGYMSSQQLLDVLNERLVAELGCAEQKYTIEQLHAEIGATQPEGDFDQDWNALRKLVAKARRDGTLQAVTRQTIDDFAVVFSLSAGQVLRLQDVLLGAKEGGDGE
ncbi:MAG: hypothetical protein Q8M53_10805 [Burkholderiales bacterium]|nr:hypothetical protein [Burkholderiales bacterium]